MKRILGLLLCVTILVGCSIKSPSTTTTNSVQNTGNASEPVIQWVNLYQVILDWSNSDYSGTKMMIGCNDALVALPVATHITEYWKFTELRTLLSTYDAEDKWFINPWKEQNAIKFQSYEIQDKKLIIKLSWLLKIWWSCEIPRLEESVKSTYKAFWFDEVELLINGKPINEQ